MFGRLRFGSHCESYIVDDLEQKFYYGYGGKFLAISEYFDGIRWVWCVRPTDAPRQRQIRETFVYLFAPLRAGMIFGDIEQGR